MPWAGGTVGGVGGEPGGQREPGSLGEAASTRVCLRAAEERMPLSAAHQDGEKDQALPYPIPSPSSVPPGLTQEDRWEPQPAGDQPPGEDLGPVSPGLCAGTGGSGWEWVGVGVPPAEAERGI